jgi:hypothetical protein
MTQEEIQAAPAEYIWSEINDKRKDLQKRMQSTIAELQHFESKLGNGEEVRYSFFAEQGGRIDKLLAEIAAEERILRKVFNNG